MSEIRDKVRQLIEAQIRGYYDDIAHQRPTLSPSTRARKILSIPELAIVDREAELPKNPYSPPLGMVHSFAGGREAECEGYRSAQQDMAGWVKEVKE